MKRKSKNQRLSLLPAHPRKTIKCFPTSKTLSTHVLNERIEIKVLLPLNPPFSEVIEGLERKCSTRSQPSTSLSNTSTSYSFSNHQVHINFEREVNRILRRTIAKKMIRRLEGNHSLIWSHIEAFMDCSWSCLYDTSRSPLAPNSIVVLNLERMLNIRNYRIVIASYTLSLTAISDHSSLSLKHFSFFLCIYISNNCSKKIYISNIVHT